MLLAFVYHLPLSWGEVGCGRLPLRVGHIPPKAGKILLKFLVLEHVASVGIRQIAQNPLVRFLIHKTPEDKVLSTIIVFTKFTMVTIKNISSGEVDVVAGNKILGVPNEGCIAQCHFKQFSVIALFHFAHLTYAFYLKRSRGEERVVETEVLSGVFCLYTKGEVIYLLVLPTHGRFEPIRNLDSLSEIQKSWAGEYEGYDSIKEDCLEFSDFYEVLDYIIDIAIN